MLCVLRRALASPLQAAVFGQDVRVAAGESTAALRWSSSRPGKRRESEENSRQASGPGVPSEYTVDENEEGMRFDRWVREKFYPLPLSFLNRLIRIGEIRLLGDGDEAKHTPVDFRLKEGDRVVAPAMCRPHARARQRQRADDGGEAAAEKEFDVGVYSERVKELKRRQMQKAREWIQSMVVYEDDAVLALNKPAGVVSAQGGDEANSVEKALKVGWPEQRWLVHRLDKDTTGLLLVAKSRRIAAYLHDEFKARRVTKTYWALVSPAPKQKDGRIKAPLFIADNKTQLATAAAAAAASTKRRVNDSDNDSGSDDKLASTEFTVLEKLGKQLALVSLNPLTGRKHQLRVHCASVLGCPIIGDWKYGPGVPESIRSQWPMKEEEPGLCLHAKTLHFAHPSVANKYITVRAPVPLAVTRFMRRLGFQTSEVLDKLDKGATKVQLDREQHKAKKLAEKTAVATRRQQPGQLPAANKAKQPRQPKSKPLVPVGKLPTAQRKVVVAKFAKKAALAREKKIKTAWLKRRREHAASAPSS